MSKIFFNFLLILKHFFPFKRKKCFKILVSLKSKIFVSLLHNFLPCFTVCEKPAVPRIKSGKREVELWGTRASKQVQEAMMKMVGGFQSLRDSHARRTSQGNMSSHSNNRSKKSTLQANQTDIDQLKKLLPGMNGTKSGVIFIKRSDRGRLAF